MEEQYNIDGEGVWLDETASSQQFNLDGEGVWIDGDDVAPPAPGGARRRPVIIAAG